MNSYRYGTECSICYEVNPSGRYQPHESRFDFCGKHTKQEIEDYQSQPEKRQRIKSKRVRRMTV